MQNSSLENKLKEISKIVESLKKEIDVYKEKTEKNYKEINEVSSSLIELNRKIEKINRDILDILKKIETVSGEIYKLKNENLYFEERLSKLESSYNLAEGKTIEDLNKEINEIKKDLQQLKSTKQTNYFYEIKDPNLKRIITSPYLVLTSLLISIFALIVAF